MGVRKKENGVPIYKKISLLIYRRYVHILNAIIWWTRQADRITIKSKIKHKTRIAVSWHTKELIMELDVNSIYYISYE
jgi:hypothetical protein